MLKEILALFEKQCPLSVMMRLALEWAMPAGWIDEVFEQTRKRQYPRELLFSTVVELVSLVSLGLRPSLHAAASEAINLPVSIAALYDKVRRTEPAILSQLVQQSAQRLAPVAEALGFTPSLPGWQLRVLDGNHLPASEKRLGPLRGYRGAALPGHTLVVYDADRGLVTDIVACEDAHAQERAVVGPLLEGAKPRELWIADRNLQHTNHCPGLAQGRCELHRARAWHAPENHWTGQVEGVRSSGDRSGAAANNAYRRRPDALAAHRTHTR